MSKIAPKSAGKTSGGRTAQPVQPTGRVHDFLFRKLLKEQLSQVLHDEAIDALFQPIVDLRDGSIVGYEGLVRGPVDTPIHFPSALLAAAQAFGLKSRLESLCVKVVLAAFVEAGLPGKLFLNVGTEWLLAQETTARSGPVAIDAFRECARRIVLELTGDEQTIDYAALRNASAHHAALGCQVAIDDLGEGFASLRLWSELRPAYVKIDMHFTRGVERDPAKRQFIRSIQDIARALGTALVAEGIETQEELLALRDLGIAYGQGYHLGGAEAARVHGLPPGLAASLTAPTAVPPPLERPGARTKATARRLLRQVTPVSPSMTNSAVFDIFARDPDLEVIPVVEEGVPLGLITRKHLLARFAAQYTRELHGRRPCTMFTDPHPLSVDQHTPLQTLSQSVVEAERHHLFNGFIITDQGAYLGMGTGHDLIREMTALQISSARYANPLTGLPGNVPINDTIDDLIASGASFVVCYFDLDNFKPFNDYYGYRKGDDVIQLTGRLLESQADPMHDFVGHIGGDDFLILFRSDDWEERCYRILDAFASAIVAHFDKEAIARGGYLSEDRQGRQVMHPFVTLSAGVVKARPSGFSSHLQIAAVASEAKKQAKRIAGNSLFIDRRSAIG